MDFLTVVTILIIISALFSYLNERLVKLPGTIGVVTLSVFVSVVILIVGKTRASLVGPILTFEHSIDFSDTLLNVMLGFLLFASALHFDYQKLKEQRRAVFVLSTLGVIVSAGVFGCLFYLFCKVASIPMPLTYCFLFGALISPTDPIAVGSILKTSRIPPRLNTIISGESLFNDGVGLVLFVVVLEIANNDGPKLSASNVLTLFATEVLGGIIIGLVLGYIGYRLIRSVRDFQTIFLLSVALVLGISVTAKLFHSSIPLSAVSAGLFIGTRGMNFKKTSAEFLARIWQLLDEVLNTVLFVMIGLQLVEMPFLNQYWLTGVFAIIIILIARAISISLPAFLSLRKVSFANLSILTWAGLRGGISIAMALSLPQSAYRETILSATYFIVIFSIIVQGLTLNKVVDRAVKE